jgi:hypothetical protein
MRTGERMVSLKPRAFLVSSPTLDMSKEVFTFFAGASSVRALPA